VPSRAETTITLTDAPEDGERTVVMDGLRAYNEERAGVSDARQLAILARDPDTGEVVGGLLGRSYLGLLTVERFFLPENLRRGGLGGRILAMAEEEGRRRGCTRAVLSTLHFLHDPSRNDVAMSNKRWRQASIIMIANSPSAGS